MSTPYLPVAQLPDGAECAKCFRDDLPLRPDPEIDEIWFCEPCWQERERVTQTHLFGYDNDIGEE
ncbi:MAG: hypothetical protein OEY97_02065 [Nitrospirota bacterium]|nr:hypothetical protein [Nitrospirota bacterium]